ncbi:MAG: hypothetical protein RLZZ214_253 [Verrucomicrobiota bacterium]
MLTQDASGVVFRALDTETDQLVAVRRFFPFGVNGGGLSDEEQADYNIAVERLCGISHPAMRSIICGGCDPVDGMPFIATEWIEGASLQAFIERGPVSPQVAAHLLTQALEVCEEISRVLGEEDVWVETDVHTIIIGVEDSGRGITFWISPLRWLGKKDGQRGLEAIASLTEDLMGWREKAILDHEGGGLGGWLKWLRGATTRISLSEAREMLAGLGGPPPATAAKRMVRPAVRGPAIKTPKRKSSLPFVLFGTLLLAAISLGGWALIHWNNARLRATVDSMHLLDPGEETTGTVIPPEPPAPEPRPKSRSAAQASLEAVELSLQAKAAETQNPVKATIPNEVFSIKDSARLLKLGGKEVTLEGVLNGFKYSNKETSLYLVFSDKPDIGEARGSVVLKNAPADLHEDKLASLKGRKIRLSGKVRIENFGKTPIISLQSRAAIQKVE